MDEKIKSLFDYIKNLRESDLDQFIHFVFGMTPKRSSCRTDPPTHIVAAIIL